MKAVLLLSLFFFASVSVRADFTIAQNGKARCVIVRQADATAPEIKAAEELAHTLEQITGAKFEIQDAGAKISERAIIIGQGKVASEYFADAPFNKLGADEIVMQMKGNKLLLAGRRPRGTLYAVCRFLQEQCGVRWWTPWATTIPKNSTLKISDLDIRYAPPFENRAPFWFPAFNAEWSYRNGSTDQNGRLTAEQGGSIKYAESMGHSFYQLVLKIDAMFRIDTDQVRRGQRII